jgi:hypothetical protein
MMREIGPVIGPDGTAAVVWTNEAPDETTIRELLARGGRTTRTRRSPARPAGDLTRGQAGQRIRRLVDAAPPLTAEQRDKLAVILRGGAAAIGDAYADAYAGKRQPRAN